jgi:hypothetical protein
MALIGPGSFRTRALQVILNAGDEFDDETVKRLGKLWRAVGGSDDAKRGTPMPDEIKSEFRRIASAVRAPRIANQIYNKRTGNNAGIVVGAAYSPSDIIHLGWLNKMKLLQPRVHYTEKFGQNAQAADAAAEAWKDVALGGRGLPIYGPGRTAMGNTDLSNMQKARYSAVRDRANRAVLDALGNLFGDLDMGDLM